MNNNQLQDLVLDWAEEKGLLKPENVLKQFAKSVSELGELGDAIIKDEQAKVVDSIGDVQVCLIILTEQLGYNYDACLQIAYDVIKKRKGVTKDGTFIKEEDLTK